MWGIGCGGTVALLAAGIWLAISGRGVLGIILIVCAVAGCFVVPHLAGTNGLPNGQFATLDDFPPIKEQLAAGWSYGDKPSNVGG